MVEIEPQDDSADNTPLGNLQKGALDVRGCITGKCTARYQFAARNLF